MVSLEQCPASPGTGYAVDTVVVKTDFMSTATAIQPATLPSLELKNIVVAVNLKEGCGNTALYALQLARIFKSRLHVVYVHDPPTLTEIAGGEAMTILEQQQRIAEQKLEVLVAELQQIHPDCNGEFLTGEPTEEIARFAEKHNADVIITASHHPGVLVRLFGLDYAPRIMHHASCPVLVVSGK
jgi:nucleotide-binding universal stress UspA family protein